MSASSPPPKFLARSASPGARPASQLAKHGKYVLLGALGCWYFDVRRLVQEEIVGSRPGSWESEKGRGYKMMVTSLSLQAVTIAIFLYLVVFLPWIRGIIPNYPSWQRSQRLRVIMPVLTTTIILGFITLVSALARGTPLGTFQSLLAATAVYLLTFGMLGVIPSPRLPPTATAEGSDKRAD